MSTDSTDRSDIMLQLFEQRLDQFRIELRNLQNNLNAATVSKPGNTEALRIQNVDSPKQENIETVKPVHSFRKLANAAIANGTSLKPTSNEPGLYDKILSFKEEVAGRHISFSDYDKEIVDYILSFQDKSKDLEYMQVHTRTVRHRFCLLYKVRLNQSRRLEMFIAIDIPPLTSSVRSDI